jgi:6-phosphogluconolactonase
MTRFSNPAPVSLRTLIVFCFAAIAALSCLHAAEKTDAQTKPLFVYFGTYTKEKSRGIYVARFDSKTGVLSPAELAVEAANPSFLAFHPNHRYVYSVGNARGSAEKPPGTIKAFAIDPDSGKLTFLNEQVAGSVATTEVSVDATGRNLLTVSYNEAFASVFSIQNDGTVGERTAHLTYTGSGVDKERQTAPHPHSINLDPSNRFVIVPDLGTDKVMQYRFDPAKGTLESNEPAFVAAHPGAGPRHLSFHPNGRYAYVITEMAATMTAYQWDATHGTLSEIEDAKTLPEDFHGANRAAEVVVHPSGRFLYASNRGHDSIAVFSISPETGRLTFVERQGKGIKYPRGYAIDPTGQWLICANMEADNATVFRIAPDTGKLIPTNQTIAVPQSVCVRFFSP